MAIVKTTRYYLNVFGSIQRDFKTTASEGSNNRDDVFEYTFPNDELFFQHFYRLNIKTAQGKLLKGKTLVGVYTRRGLEKKDRPRPRMNSQKFRERDE